jgi:transcriptional antiterminator RfaH
MENRCEKKWWLLTTKPHKDAYAEEQLVNQGYDVYRPLAKRLRKRRGKMKVTLESLFPRYLFIQLDELNDNWSPIRSTRGVMNFVRFGDKPAKVPNAIIERLQFEEDINSENAINLDRFAKGEAVIINEGPYKGLHGVFQNYNGEERAIVLLNILNTVAKLPVSTAMIESLN